MRDFLSFGERTSELKIDLQPAVTASVGRNDSGKSAVIYTVGYAPLTRGQQFIRDEPEEFDIDDAGQPHGVPGTMRTPLGGIASGCCR